jgi:hypothetical protein
MIRESRLGTNSSASRGWWKPGRAFLLKFPFELQAEDLSRLCRESAVTMEKRIEVLYVSKLGFTKLSGTAWRITLRLIYDEEFFVYIFILLKVCLNEVIF